MLELRARALHPNMSSCVNVRTVTEVLYAFCFVHCYRGAAAGVCPGSEGRRIHEPVERAGCRSERRPEGRRCNRDHDGPRELHDRMCQSWSFEKSMRQRLSSRPLPSRRRAALLRVKVAIPPPQPASSASAWRAAKPAPGTARCSSSSLPRRPPACRPRRSRRRRRRLRGRDRSPSRQS